MAVVQAMPWPPRVERLNFMLYSPTPSLQERVGQRQQEIQDLLTHRTEDRTRRYLTLTRADITAGGLQQLAETTAEDQVIGLCSRCQTIDNQIRHLPLMDFKIPVNPENQTLITQAAKSLEVGGGWLFDSGRSYHFIGRELLTLDEFIDFLGRSALLSDLVDTRYIGHRLIERNGVLRLTAGPRKPRAPVLVAEV